MEQINQITITKPNDYHLHLRDGEALKSVVNFTAQQMGVAVVMPNLVPPVTTAKMALEYKQRILDVVGDTYTFEPLMTLYLVASMDIAEVQKAKDAGVVGFKLYPAGATTNSDFGVSDIKDIYPILEEMQKVGMPLLVHGEVVDKDIDIFDREKVFIDRILTQVIKDFPELKVGLEHITTKDSVDFVQSASDNIIATITPQHLLNNRNDMLVGGIKPHYYCLPILKRNTHQQALIKAATSGNPKFFLGTDSAPHAKGDKESACGCAGCFSAPFAIEFYAEVFDKAGALDKLEDFSSTFGAKFYNLPKNNEKITLIRNNFTVGQEYKFADKTIVPYGFGNTFSWQIKE
jgi:dihydroorotase